MTALEAVTGEYKDFVLGILIKKVHNPTTAKELYSVVCEKVLLAERSGKYIDQGKIRSWLGTITGNTVKDHWRHLSAKNIVERDDLMFRFEDSGDAVYFSDMLPADGWNWEENQEKRDTLDEMLEKVEKLPKSQRTAVEMRFFREMSFKEMAEETGLSINTVLGQIRYALINLRKMYNYECQE